MPKRIGSVVWVHKSSQDELPQDLLKRAKSKVTDPFDVIKYDKASGDFTFIRSKDFNTAPEPTVGDAVLVRKDGSTKVMKQKSDPQIYHHKHLFVKPDYKGFDVEASKRRSERIEKLGVDKSRIGTLSYWKENVLPKLKENRMTIAKKFLSEMDYASKDDDKDSAAKKYKKKNKDDDDKDESFAGKFLREAQKLYKSGGVAAGQIDDVRIVIHPLKAFGKNSAVGKHLKDPSESEFESAVEDASNKGFQVVHVYTDNQKRIMKMI